MTAPNRAVIFMPDKNSCFAAAAKFTNSRDFKKNASSEYQWLRRNGHLKEACAHFVRLARSLSDDDIAMIARNFTHRMAFKQGDFSAYMAAWRRGLLDQVCAHMESRRRELSDTELAAIASRFGSRKEFMEADDPAYQAASKRGILNEICANMGGRPTRRLTDAQILDIARQYKTRNDFKLGDFGAYTTAIRRGLIEQACEHMEYGATGYREDKPAVLYHYRIVLPDGSALYKVGITNRKPRQRLFTMGLIHGAKAELLRCDEFALGRDARIAERNLHGKLAGYRYCGPAVLRNGNTEVFTINPLEQPWFVSSAPAKTRAPTSTASPSSATPSA